MKKYFAFLYLTTTHLYAQISGQWTWQSGEQGSSFLGRYGTMGVSSASNAPPGTYEASEWQDLQGNFWFYGGDRLGLPTNDLWNFNIVKKEWTWLSGSKGQGSMRPSYGLTGVPSSTNSPGLRQTSLSWVDLQGNFWLYGGFGCDTTGSATSITYNDLWKYNPDSTAWTWMKGTKFGGGFPNYGTKGLEAITNLPPPLNETDLTWTDSYGDLWLMDNNACLWKYRLATNNWIWMKGNYSATSAVYGVKGQASVLNNPGPTSGNFTRWKDSKGDFWYFDGLLWKYGIQNDSWTWVWGDTLNIYSHNYGMQKCDTSNHIIDPEARIETRACWVDDCDNFWMMGGSTGWQVNDLVFFNQKENEWVLVSGDTTELTASTYGTLHIASPFNRPSSRCGALPYKDVNGNLWLFGGIAASPLLGINYYSDLWMYTPDTTCTHCKPKHPNYDGLFESADSGDQLSVFPNPAQDELQIQLTNEARDEPRKVFIYNKIWQMVREEDLGFKEGKAVVQTEGLGSGIYFLQLKNSSNEVIRKRFVIAR